jgi:hypothetical protein
VGILVNKKLNFNNNGVIRDCDGNYIIVKAEINNLKLILCAIYGPNDNDPDFFTNLESDLNRMLTNEYRKIVVGGDWNATWDTRETNNNIDIINMAAIPSRYGSGGIKN